MTLGPALVIMFLSSSSAIAAPTISEYPLVMNGRAPAGIAAGPEGNLWFAEYAGPGAVGRITTSGAVTEYPSGPNSQSFGIALGPEGDLWFTEPNAEAIGRSTPSGSVSQFSVPRDMGASQRPADIATGANGDLWFTIYTNPAGIGRITPEGTITIFDNGLPASSDPRGITTGPEGDMWFTELGNPGAIGRITPAGAITSYATGLTTDSEPADITSGPEGDLWFTEAADPGAIGRITPEGTITQYSTGLLANLRPEEIAAGDNGDVYFTEFNNPGEIGELTPTGTISQIPTPTSNSQPEGIAAGPSGNIWFTEVAGNGKIGTLTIAPAASATTAADVTQQGATLTASVTPNSQATEYSFQYGTSSTYEAETEPVSAGSGAGAVAVSSALSGLAPSTTYDFRLVAKNASGTTYGPEGSLTTAGMPAANTLGAIEISLTTATLRGDVDPNGEPTSYSFEWGATASYGNVTPAAEGYVGAESSEYPIAQSVGRLEPGTLYHFRIVASDCDGCTAGTTYGQDMTFTTASAPLSEAPSFPTASAPALATSPPSSPPPVAPPAIGQTAVLGAVSGSVLIELPGSGKLVPISSLSDIPIGSTIDAQHGVVRVTTALDGSGRLQSADVWDGTFTLGQRRGAGMTTFTLPTPRGCMATGRGGADRSSALATAASDSGSKAAPGLWAKDDHGKYSTRGKNSVATVRGTDWETVNRCDGTLTFVKHGVVGVRDLHTGRTVTLKAGQRFLARR